MIEKDKKITRNQDLTFVKGVNLLEQFNDDLQYCSLSVINQDKNKLHPTELSLMAREALKMILPQINTISLDQTQFGNLTHLPLIKLSFSHTQYNGVINSGALCYVQPSSKILDLGLDIENKNRVVNSRVEKYFIPEGKEMYSDFSTLELWVLKEAIYKALNARMYRHDVKNKENQEVFPLHKIQLTHEFLHTNKIVYGLYLDENSLIGMALKLSESYNF